MGPGKFCRCSPNVRWPRRSSTWWSRPLAGEWERYLKQQIELGGAELVLSTAGKRGSREAGKHSSGDAGRQDGGEAGTVILERASPLPSVPTSPLTRWQQG